jgi:hypothetical protein
VERGRNTLYVDYREKGAAGEYDDVRPGFGSYVTQSILAALLVTLTVVLTQYTSSALAMVANYDEFIAIGLIAIAGGAAISLSGMVLKKWLKDLT